MENYNNQTGNENLYRRSYQAEGSYREVHPEQNGQYSYNYTAQPQNTAAPVKKKSSLAGKIAVAMLTGVIFGGSAAGAIWGVNKIAGIYDSPVPVLNTASERDTDRAEVLKKKKEETAASQSADAESSGMNIGTTAVVTDVTKVVEKVMPSIVSITNSSSYNYFYYTIPSESKGSGIIIGSNDDELLIVTNYHVVEDNDELSVTFTDESSAKALVKGTDSSMDLAVIAVALSDLDDDTLNAINIAEMGDSDALKVGEPAIAIGNALGYGQSVTTGVISALNRKMEMENVKGTFIQTDAAINQGNSGGALLNISGKVIGINSNKIGGSTVEGMGYAIPISAARPIIENLMTKTTRTLVSEEDRGYLGITGATVTAEEAQYYGYPEGVYVVSVTDGSPAEEAGLKKGDYITSLDGEKVDSMEKLQKLLMYYEEGSEAELGVTRVVGNNYKDINITVELGDRSILNRIN